MSYEFSTIYMNSYRSNIYEYPPIFVVVVYYDSIFFINIFYFFYYFLKSPVLAATPDTLPSPTIADTIFQKPFIPPPRIVIYILVSFLHIITFSVSFFYIISSQSSSLLYYGSYRFYMHSLVYSSCSWFYFLNLHYLLFYGVYTFYFLLTLPVLAAAPDIKHPFSCVSLVNLLILPKNHHQLG